MPRRDVAQYGYVSARQVVCFHRVLDEKDFSRSPDELDFAVRGDPAKKLGSGVPGVARRQIKLLDRVSHEFIARGSEQGQRCGVRFETNPLVAQDQNGVERAIEDGLEFAFGRIENTGGFAVRAVGQQQEADVQSDCRTESGKNEGQQHGSQVSAIRARHERGNTESGDGKSDDERTSFDQTAAGALVAN